MALSIHPAVGLVPLGLVLTILFSSQAPGIPFA